MSGLFSSFSSGKSANSSKTASVKSAKDTPKTSEIYTTPLDGCTPKKKWEYTPEQLQTIEDLKAYSATLLLPPSDPYNPWERRFLADPGTHPRYMRASKWKPEDAKRRIKGTIEWRREYKPELIQPGDVGVEAETGKIIVSGFDNDARPIVYMRPGRENTERSDRQMRHLIYHLERAIDLCPPGQEQVAIIVDYKSATSQSNPSLGLARKVLNILQNHYVERLGRGLVTNMPWWINAFFQGLTPLMDPITRDKVRFNPNLLELVPAAHLDAEYGGDYNLDFDHKVYWDTITEFCRISPSGGRIDKDGKDWIPPAGNGIKAASDGLLPKKGAVAPGEMTSNPDEAMSPIVADGTGATAVKGTGFQSDAEKIASTHRASLDTNPPPISSTATATATATAATGEKDISQSVAGLSIADSDSQSDVPAVETKPGPPVGNGEVVFDHPPSKAEVAEVRQSLEGR